MSYKFKAKQQQKCEKHEILFFESNQWRFDFDDSDLVDLFDGIDISTQDTINAEVKPRADTDWGSGDGVGFEAEESVDIEAIFNSIEAGMIAAIQGFVEAVNAGGPPG